MKEMICLFMLAAAACEDMLERHVSGYLFAALASAGVFEKVAAALFRIASAGTAEGITAAAVGSAAAASFQPAALPALIPGAVLLLVSLLSQGELGEGDAYCFIALGFSADAVSILALMMFSFVSAGVYALAVCLVRRRISVHESFAFIPFVLFAYALLAMAGCL